MTLDSSLLPATLADMRVAVVGDVCLDWYLFIDPERSEISVETGKATRPVGESRYSPGGAGNVAANLAGLGVGSVFAYGVVGEDPFADALSDALEARDVVPRLETQHDHWHTSVYTKMYEGEQEARRIDFGNYNRLAKETGDRLIASLSKQIDSLDLLLINQQLLYGVHTPYFRARIVELVANHPELTVLTDSRDWPAEYERTIRKLNQDEAARCCGRDPEQLGLADIPDLARELATRWRQPVIVTRGRYGCVVAHGDGPSTADVSIDSIPGVELTRPGDIVGAGDAFLAGYAVGLLAGLGSASAATLANYTAAVTVSRRFETGTASLDEVTTLAADPTLLYRPEAAFSPPRLLRSDSGIDLEIELISEEPDRSFHTAVFDHDGTISSLRQGWESVMAPMMIEAISGGRSVSPEKRAEIVSAVDDFIDRTTGIQTISQMIGLVSLVEEFGIVPPEAILSPAEYKEIYNRSLLEMVEKRTAKFKRGELSVEDVTIKGAVAFLESLAERGITLYLASGTDEEDVRTEAELLGYRTLFAGRIYGATGSVTDEPKKRALGRILEDAGSIDGVMTFGDGPVEMRETVKRGGYAVGIASDEIRRYGFNPSKRTRLVLAGADIVVPDFSQYDSLLETLGIRDGSQRRC